MLKTAIDTLDTVIQSLGYINRYGGLVIPITEAIEIGQDAQEQPIFDYRTYPVTAKMDGIACFEQGKYSDLIPRDIYSSLAYFEQQSSLQRITSDASYDTVSFAGSVRMVVWLNIPKLNINNTGATDLTISQWLAPHLTSKIEGTKPISDAVLTGYVDFEFSGMPIKSHELFGKYSYGNSRELSYMLLYPYDFFAIDFDVKITFNKSCVNDLVVGAPVDCITL